MNQPLTLVLTYADGHQVTVPGVNTVDTTGRSLVCWCEHGVSQEPGLDLVGVQVWDEDELENAT